MRSPSRKNVPAAPDGLRLYAIGDIHGCIGPLDRLTAKIVEDRKSASGHCALVYLGDYIDRGPDSKGVIDRLLEPPQGFDAYHVRGNHDQALLDFLAEPGFYPQWRDFGGRETIASYGVASPREDGEGAYRQLRDSLSEALPAEHLAFFQRLPLTLSFGDYLFVHAGVRPGVMLAEQQAEDLLWIREEFLTSTADFGAVVIHGHTPAEQPVRRPNRIGVDTGCYATGRLTAAVIEGTSCRFLQS